MVFIPKQGNRALDQPKSSAKYRPISLSSFFLKTAERLVDLHVRCTLQATKPLHKTQFAYIKGGSTPIDKSLKSKEIAMCSLLNVEGAFDNTGYQSISRALSRRNIDTVTVAWKYLPR